MPSFLVFQMIRTHLEQRTFHRELFVTLRVNLPGREPFDKRLYTALPIDKEREVATGETVAIRAHPANPTMDLIVVW